MSIPVECPGCSARLNAPDSAAGRKVRCPRCQAPITVPAAGADALRRAVPKCTVLLK